METTNANLLDDNFSNVTAKKSLAQLTGCKKPSKGARVLAGFLTGGISNLATKKKFKAKMTAYNQCLDAYKAKVEAGKDATAKAELKTAQAIEPVPTPEEVKKMAQDMGDAPDTNDGKILGMPKGLAIGLGIAIVAIGGFIVYKKFIAKK